MKRFEYKAHEEELFEDNKRELEEKGFKQIGDVFTVVGENLIYKKDSEIVTLTLEVKEPVKGGHK